MTEGGDEQGPPQFSSGRPARLAPRAGRVIRSIHGLEHAQDVGAVVVGVGLVAVIRKILFILSSQKQVSTSVLALLIAMVAVFVLGLVVVSRFEKSAEPDAPDQ